VRVLAGAFLTYEEIATDVCTKIILLPHDIFDLQRYICLCHLADTTSYLELIDVYFIVFEKAKIFLDMGRCLSLASM
jgi:hypothetical protein